MEMIRLENLQKNFKSLKVLKNINLKIENGEIVSIIGPSGSGKSTLLRTINHLEVINHGKIFIQNELMSHYHHGHKATHIPEKKVQKICKKIGMVFQNFNLFPHMSVMENIVEAPIHVNKKKLSEAKEIAEYYLHQVGLTDKKNAYPYQLSGGQKQRVAIARALAMKPEIMLFDEPTSALDPELVGEVLNVIKALTLKHMTMVIVTHEMNFAKEVCHRIIFMDEGNILADTFPNQIFTAPDHPRIKTFIDKML